MPTWNERFWKTRASAAPEILRKASRHSWKNANPSGRMNDLRASPVVIPRSPPEADDDRRFRSGRKESAFAFQLWSVNGISRCASSCSLCRNRSDGRGLLRKLFCMVRNWPSGTDASPRIRIQANGNRGRLFHRGGRSQLPLPAVRKIRRTAAHSDPHFASWKSRRKICLRNSARHGRLFAGYRRNHARDLRQGRPPQTVAGKISREVSRARGGHRRSEPARMTQSVSVIELNGNDLTFTQLYSVALQNSKSSLASVSAEPIEPSLP